MADEEQPFSYADAVASNVEEPPAEEQEQYAAPEAPAEDSAGVQEALEAAGDSATAAAGQLWRLDAPNRLTPDVDYKINIQYKASRDYEEDNADETFIEFISDSVFERPSYGLFYKLLDNYTAETGVPERKTSEEMQEESEFLDVVVASDVGQFTRQWLSANCPDAGVESDEDFKGKLHDMWFALYGRDARGDTSGFEHVFTGEIDDGKVKGLHNFIQVYVEEQRGNFNYKGFLTYGRKRGEYVEDTDRLISIRFEWLNYLKSASSMFIGTSPEFEMCLYTLMYLAGTGGETVELGCYDVCVKVYDMHGHIGSSFPELEAVDSSNPDAGIE